MSADWYDAFRESLRAGNEHRKRLDGEFLRLCAEPCMKPVSAGDRVIVAAGLIGHGYPWVRTEAIAIEVGDASVKVRSVGDLTDWEQWVHPALIVDVLGPPVAVAEDIDDDDL